MFLIYGVKKHIITMDQAMVNCPSCEGICMAEIFVTGNYYHIYFIPVFPFEKEISIQCATCGLNRYNLPLNKKNLPSYAGTGQSYPHPWYSYSLAACFLILVTLAIYFSSNSSPS